MLDKTGHGRAWDMGGKEKLGVGEDGERAEIGKVSTYLDGM